jgi:wobble nucleotide-excising tRNase
MMGYRIMRGAAPAEYLSEGEKTAVAFVHFIVHLSDKGFSLTDGIVVIDDPISSLDANSIYQAFSFLKDAVKEAKQVFVFTHNFDFLKLVLNWCKNPHSNKVCTGFFMIKNRIATAGVREAYLGEMDRELRDYESEYHYLFKLLKQMRAEQDESIAKAYNIPNIARKVFDTFLMFSIPNGGTQYSKVQELKRLGHDGQKLDAVYKFTNDQSHITGAGFNPALVPEAKKAVDTLFEMMEGIAPTHYKVLEQATS